MTTSNDTSCDFNENIVSDFQTKIQEVENNFNSKVENIIQSGNLDSIGSTLQDIFIPQVDNIYDNIQTQNSAISKCIDKYKQLAANDNINVPRNEGGTKILYHNFISIYKSKLYNLILFVFGILLLLSLFFYLGRNKSINKK